MSDWLSERENKKANQDDETQRKEEAELRKVQEESQRIARMVNQQKWEWINQVIASYIERYNNTVPTAPSGKGGPEYSKLFHYRHDNRTMLAVCFGGDYSDKISPYKIMLLKFIDENNLALSFHDKTSLGIYIKKGSFDFLSSRDQGDWYETLDHKYFGNVTKLVASSTVNINQINETDISEWIKETVTNPKILVPPKPSLPSSWQGRPPAKSSCMAVLLLGFSGLMIISLLLRALIQNL